MVADVRIRMILEKKRIKSKIFFCENRNFLNFASGNYLMQNRTLFVFIFSAALLLFGCSDRKSLNRELEKMADNLNKSAPVQLDEHTVFLRAEVTADNVFRYCYKIINTNAPQSLMEAVEAQTKTNIREAFRMNPDLRLFTVNDVNIDYVYTDSAGQPIKTIHITPKDYK